ncbi:CaiB/BaiF CoA transferase family protein [Paracoccus tegillarcae]|uniref:Carnitine dehydratase n=1 Tax=Paracoccus tegillarcae TaxID=1529068 RepID=A0A2K9EBQ6_9RHOB|nr:CoA transferase [Paracoccus tegillarcae]AUH32330.1 carnitine dehydratase [Paracoccus tegillarcae]
MADEAAKGALHGLRVIDLTRVLSGPFCTMILGDLGADVIKVETPRGDPVRGQGTMTDGVSGYFAGFNRNKRSVVLDLYSEGGKTALRRLLSDADVLVENFRPGTLDKLGLSAEVLQALNPRLIVASVNGYGSSGPHAGRPAFDFIAQAMSGFMGVNGAADGAPMRAAPPISDLVAGLYAALGVVAAVVGRQRTGQGQTVEVAMVNSLVSMMAYLASEYFATGRVPQRTGNDHPLVYPYGLFDCADGQIAVANSHDEILRRFLDRLDLGWIMSDPRYETNAGRMARREELRELINSRMAGQPRAHWLQVLNAAGVPCGEVKDLAQVFADPQIAAQDMVIEADWQDGPSLKMPGFPVKLGTTPCTVHRPVPRLGGHTAEILAEVGFAPDQIAALVQAGAVGPGDDP